METSQPYRVLCGWSWFEQAADLDAAYAIRTRIETQEDGRPVHSPRWEWDRLGRPPMLLKKRDDDTGLYDEIPWPDGKTYKTAGNYVCSAR